MLPLMAQPGWVASLNPAEHWNSMAGAGSGTSELGSMAGGKTFTSRHGDSPHPRKVGLEGLRGFRLLDQNEVIVLLFQATWREVRRARAHPLVVNHIALQVHDRPRALEADSCASGASRSTAWRCDGSSTIRIATPRARAGTRASTTGQSVNE